ncbi:chemotaxis protein CheW [candidate division KSB1 bacterium]|nr:chemotaxis protein CheW [candidate division KSB1 bacterium]
MPEVDAAKKMVTSAGSSSNEGQMVVFRLLEEEFGVDINNVKEIVRLPDITPIPRSPNYVSGICNLRGNVLPVIDTRIRFGMDMKDVSDQTRLLVVEKNGINTGLVVDQMREVMRADDSLIDPPPAVCRGVDREFLSGVVKIDDGKRLILMLNLDEVINIDVATLKQSDIASSDVADNKQATDDNSEEEHLVSFRVGNDEYAFDIARVREILKVRDVTAVPNVPDYVKGLFTIRNHLLPIVDLRGLLGLPSLISERNSMIVLAIEEDQQWVENLLHVLESKSHFTGITNSHETVFGKWLETYNTSSVEVENVVKRLKHDRAELYSMAIHAMELRAKTNDAAVAYYNEKVEPLLNVVRDTYKELKTAMEQHIQDDQRTLVVESNTMTIGYLVDSVDEVIRIPHSVIDNTPAMAASDRKELKAVAKLNDGKRLIMIMDEAALVSSETEKRLDEIVENQGMDLLEDGAEKSLAEQSLDEEQLVTFSINNEEYGIRIMQIQEINRIKDITHVPRAPFFIDGMTNLRGEVIPVVNIRKLFDLENKEIDDKARIIIVDIAGHKTGLRVDQVNEVLRLAKQQIEDTSSLVNSNTSSNLIQGVCKIDDGKRLVLLLDMEHILSKKELNALTKVSNDDTKSTDATNVKPKESKSAYADIDRNSTSKTMTVGKKKLAPQKAKAGPK